MSTQEKEPNRSLIREILGTLPPLAKTVLMWFLLFPLAISISGLLLQVNVGALIQDSLRQSRGQTVDIVGQMLNAQVVKISNSLDRVEQALDEYDTKFSELDKRLLINERDLTLYRAQFESIDKRLELVETQLNAKGAVQ